MTWTSGQYGPDAQQDTLGDALIGAAVTVPDGYTYTQDQYGNLTIIGPATDALTYVITPVGGSAITRVCRVEPLAAEVDSRVQTALSAANAAQTTANTAQTAAGTAQTSADNKIETVNAVNSGSGYTIPDVTSFTLHRITLNAATPALTLPTPAAGKSFTFELRQDGTGSRIPTLATPSGAIKYANGTAPTYTTTANKSDLLSALCTDGTNWIVLVAGQGI